MMPPRERSPMKRRGSRLSRRGFVVGAAGAGLLAGCGRLPWQPEPPAPRVPRIGGVFFVLPASAPEAEAFRQGLRELGYVDGQNIALEWRSAEGSPERAAALVAELLVLPVDLFVTAGGTIQEAKDATTTV